MLFKLLDNPQGAVYAAAALGDSGGDDVAMKLVSVHPDYSFELNGARQFTNYKGIVKTFHHSDNPSLSAGDWVPRTAHMILHSLCRSRWQSPETLAALRGIVPRIIWGCPMIGMP